MPLYEETFWYMVFSFGGMAIVGAAIVWERAKAQVMRSDLEKLFRKMGIEDIESR